MRTHQLAVDLLMQLGIIPSPDITLTVSQQLAEYEKLEFDMEMLGINIFQKLPDGTIRRIDPATVKLKVSGPKSKDPLTIEVSEGQYAQTSYGPRWLNLPLLKVAL